jgi:hypothetical protein
MKALAMLMTSAVDVTIRRATCVKCPAADSSSAHQGVQDSMWLLEFAANLQPSRVLVPVGPAMQGRQCFYDCPALMGCGTP